MKILVLLFTIFFFLQEMLPARSDAAPAFLKEALLTTRINRPLSKFGGKTNGAEIYYFGTITQNTFLSIQERR